MTQEYKKGQFFAIQRHDSPTLTDIFPRYRTGTSNQHYLYSNDLNSTAEPLNFQPMSTIDFEERVVYRSSPSKNRNSPVPNTNSPLTSSRDKISVRNTSVSYMNETPVKESTIKSSLNSITPPSVVSEQRSSKSSSSQIRNDTKYDSIKTESVSSKKQSNNEIQNNKIASKVGSSPTYQTSTSPKPSNSISSPPKYNQINSPPKYSFMNSSPKLSTNSPTYSKSTAQNSISSKPTYIPYQSPLTKSDKYVLDVKEDIKSPQSGSYTNSSDSTKTSPINYQKYQKTPAKTNYNISNRSSKKYEVIDDKIEEEEEYDSDLPIEPMPKQEETKTKSPIPDNYKNISNINIDESDYSEYDDSEREDQISDDEEEEYDIDETVQSFFSPLKPPLSESHSVPPSPKSKKSSYEEIDTDSDDEPKKNLSPTRKSIIKHISENSDDEPEQVLSPTQKSIMIDGDHSQISDDESEEEKEFPSIVSPRKFNESAERSFVNDTQNGSAIGLPYYDPSLSVIDDEIEEKVKEKSPKEDKTLSPKVKSPRKQYRSSPSVPQKPQEKSPVNNSKSPKNITGSSPVNVTYKSPVTSNPVPSKTETISSRNNTNPAKVESKEIKKPVTTPTVANNVQSKNYLSNNSANARQNPIQKDFRPTSKPLLGSKPIKNINDEEDEKPSYYSLTEEESYDSQPNQAIKQKISDSYKPKQSISDEEESFNYEEDDEMLQPSISNHSFEEDKQYNARIGPGSAISQNSYSSMQTIEVKARPSEKPKENPIESKNSPLDNNVNPLQKLLGQINIKSEEKPSSQPKSSVPQQNKQQFNNNFQQKVNNQKIIENVTPIQKEEDKSHIDNEEEEDEFSIPDIAKKYLDSNSDDSDIELPPEAIKYLEEENTQVSLSDDQDIENNSPQKTTSGVDIQIGSKMNDESIEDNVRPVVSISQCSNVGYNSQAVSISIKGEEEEINDEEDGNAEESEEDIDISNIEEILKKYNVDLEEESQPDE